MMGFLVAPPEYLAEINRGFTGNAPGEARIAALGACYGAICYYDSPEEKVASAVGSILKGHFFADGNKRTALFAYILLCRLNNLDFIEDEDRQARIMVESAAAEWDVAKLKNLLFPSV